MTGSSLGQRTGSYGSLPQHLQNSAVLQIRTTPSVGRKPSKMVLSSAREKEKILQWLFKIAVRRRIMIPFLVLVSVLLFIMLVFALSRDSDEDATEGSSAQSRSSPYFQTVELGNGNIISTHHKHPLLSGGQDNKRGNNESFSWSEVKSLSVDNTTLHLPPGILAAAFPQGHPCENFAFPPPPADRKRIGPRPCPVCYLPVEQAMALMPAFPSASPILKNLTYVLGERLLNPPSSGGSSFGGYPSLKQRNDSFNIRESMNIHCGFVKGNKPGQQTGFDIDEVDLLEMEQCHGIVIASAIFGNYDIIQQPKNISEAARKNACFFMFLDEDTESYMKNSSLLDGTNKVGLWRVVIVHNLPYVDARRNGKVPKLLLHRIFPNARYSIWIDGKLELVVDPYQILERFLWRKNASFAISRHYRRFDVFEEAEANKAAGKYDNASIDYQVEFYKEEGLTHYSSAKLPITSDVPEGCVIIREHIPITDLFTCLWFNEVDRFTSRDQISFSTVRDKIMSQVNWGVEMFLDCERRSFVVQGYHRDVLEALEHMSPPVIVMSTKALPAVVPDRDKIARTPPRKVALRHGREKRSGSRRRRSRTVIGRDTNLF